MVVGERDGLHHIEVVLVQSLEEFFRVGEAGEGHQFLVLQRCQSFGRGAGEQAVGGEAVVGVGVGGGFVNHNPKVGALEGGEGFAQRASGEGELVAPGIAVGRLAVDGEEVGVAGDVLPLKAIIENQQGGACLFGAFDHAGAVFADPDGDGFADEVVKVEHRFIAHLGGGVVGHHLGGVGGFGSAVAAADDGDLVLILGEEVFGQPEGERGFAAAAHREIAHADSGDSGVVGVFGAVLAVPCGDFGIGPCQRFEQLCGEGGRVFPPKGRGGGWEGHGEYVTRLGAKGKQIMRVRAEWWLAWGAVLLVAGCALGWVWQFVGMVL